MSKELSYLEVAEMAACIAQKLKIEISSVEEVLRLMNRPRSLPQQYHNTELQLWVDKRYIAYSRHKETDIHYLYLTMAHIHEEETSYKEVRLLRKNDRSLPESIQQQFTKASLWMAATDEKYIIF